MSMRSTRKIKRLFDKAGITLGPGVDERICGDAASAFPAYREPQLTRAVPDKGRIIMNSRITKIAVAAALLIAVLLGLHYLGSPVGTTVAWAEVLQKMDSAQAVTFAFESENVYEEDEHWGGKGEMKIKGPFRRYDGTSGHRFGDGPLHEETLSEVCDLSRQNRFIMLKPQTKWAFTADSHGNADRLLTYDGLKQDFRDGTEEDLGEVKIDGRKTICFRITKDDKTITVWADPDTAMPVRIEQTADGGRGKLTLSHIAFDVPLKDELFDMTPPPDYVVVNMTTEVFTIPFELTEKHLVQALAIQAKSYGGRFPILWMGGRPGKEALDASIAESKTAVPVEEGDNAMLGTEYVKRLPKGSEWQYLGEGVQLGEASKPVFWYRKPDAKTGRVIYGDLNVRDVAVEDLPKAPWPPRRK
jgi:hypothetical protein